MYKSLYKRLSMLIHLTLLFLRINYWSLATNWRKITTKSELACVYWCVMLRIWKVSSLPFVWRVVSTLLPFEKGAPSWLMSPWCFQSLLSFYLWTEQLILLKFSQQSRFLQFLMNGELLKVSRLFSLSLNDDAGVYLVYIDILIKQMTLLSL